MKGDIVALPVLLLILIAVISLLFFQFRTGVPSYPTSKAEIAAVIELLKKEEVAAGALIYELGCGWGSMLLPLAKTFPHINFVGIEISPFPWLVAKIRSYRKSNIQVILGDFFKRDLSDADAICCYLMIAPMEPLAKKFDKELSDGVRVVSVSFQFRDRQPIDLIKGQGIFKADVALYRWSSQKSQMKGSSLPDNRGSPENPGTGR